MKRTLQRLAFTFLLAAVVAPTFAQQQVKVKGERAHTNVSRSYLK